MSIIFYSWGESVFVLVMLYTVTISYISGVLLGYSVDVKKRKYVSCIGVGLVLLPLVFYKYSYFLSENIGLLFDFTRTDYFLDVHLPLGISFFSFQAISYIVDVYRNDVKYQKSFLILGFYISFFPQLIAGPIVRYHDIVKQFDYRRESIALVSSGVQRFLLVSTR